MSDQQINLTEILEDQKHLEEEASAAAEEDWGDEDRCTFDDGYTTQAVFACDTCYDLAKKENPNAKIEHFGFCYGCSMNCHLEHEVIELFVKHNFRCDCGTPRSKCKCKFDTAELRKENNQKNEYGHNYEGLYCYCDGPYNNIEMIMYQCVCCTDWFHLNCIQDQETNTVPDSEVVCDFVCSNCSKKYSNIFSHYTNQLIFPQLEKDSKSEENINKEESKCKLKNSSERKVEWKNTFWNETWRSELCRCEECIKQYEELKISQLIEEIVHEENNETEKPKATKLSFDDILADPKVPHVTKIAVAEKFKQFKDALVNHLKRAYEENPDKEAITVNDIQTFTDAFVTNKKRREM